jgi:hypothetical protein
MNLRASYRPEFRGEPRGINQLTSTPVPFQAIGPMTIINSLGESGYRDNFDKGDGSGAKMILLENRSQGLYYLKVILNYEVLTRKILIYRK